jgi:superfamily II DNA or RNA helicase
MDRRNIGTYYLGLSATPMSKGLGKIFDDLVVPITPRELISKGYLVPTSYYAGHTIDTKGVKTKALPTGGSDWNPKSLAEAIEKDTVLEGDVVENIKRHGQGRMGICFSPSVEQSKSLCRALNAQGISAEHISGYTPENERLALYEAHKAGDFQLLCNSMLLSVGYDEPGVSLLCDMYPVKSKIMFVQRSGRIWRTARGKSDSVYLDFAGNLRRHGFPEDIVPVSLDDGEKKFSEENQTKKEEKEPKMHTCPQCSSLFTGRRCLACGYEIPKNESIYHDDQILEKVEKVTMEDKTRFYQELLGYSLDHGFNEGWAAWTYKEKYKVWPKGIDKIPRKPKSDDVLGFIKHKMIRRAHARRNTR